ncbi:MAG: hypothetical protein Q7R81_04020 [Candidatus Peregrinibacteria bacterium]|nr:hypothetical protein [Candidatus Peregrinibacteria bacterium]
MNVPSFSADTDRDNPVEYAVGSQWEVTDSTAKIHWLVQKGLLREPRPAFVRPHWAEQER